MRRPPIAHARRLRRVGLVNELEALAEAAGGMTADCPVARAKAEAFLKAAELARIEAMDTTDELRAIGDGLMAMEESAP